MPEEDPRETRNTSSDGRDTPDQRISPNLSPHPRKFSVWLESLYYIPLAFPGDHGELLLDGIDSFSLVCQRELKLARPVSPALRFCKETARSQTKHRHPLPLPHDPPWFLSTSTCDPYNWYHYPEEEGTSSQRLNTRKTKTSPQECKATPGSGISNVKVI